MVLPTTKEITLDLHTSNQNIDIQPLLDLGLTENTNNRHRLNGTRSFFDPQTQASYQTHTNGLIRRTVYHTYITTYSDGHPTRIHKSSENYQINPLVRASWTIVNPCTYTGKRYEYKSNLTRFHIYPPQKRIEEIARKVISFRKYRNGQTKNNFRPWDKSPIPAVIVKHY